MKHPSLKLSGGVLDREKDIMEAPKHDLVPAESEHSEDLIVEVGGTRMAMVPVEPPAFRAGDVALYCKSDWAGRLNRRGGHSNYGYSGYFKASVFDGQGWRNFKLWDFVPEADRQYKTQPDKVAVQERLAGLIAARAGATLLYGDRTYVLEGARLPASTPTPEDGDNDLPVWRPTVSRPAPTIPTASSAEAAAELQQRRAAAEAEASALRSMMCSPKGPIRTSTSIAMTTKKPSTQVSAVTSTAFPADYENWLETVKQRIAQTQTRAAVAVNREMVLLYWELGRDILARQAQHGWGAKVVERIAADLRHAFPAIKGFSRSNLMYMRAFASAWPEFEFVQAVLGQLPWYHQIALLDRLQTREQREWYARQAIQYGWSRNVLVHQIESRLKERQGAAVTNFAVTLPPEKSELAQHLIKDPQIFDFLNLGPEFLERELEDALVGQMQRFLLELGRGFAFVGRQYHLEVGGQDFYIDLLFYHLHLHSYFAVELKIDEFKPAYVGQMQFYLTALDKQVKTTLDGPSIGLILCKTKNGLVAEYALLDANKPMGVAEYRFTLPATLANALPTVEDIVEGFVLRAETGPLDPQGHEPGSVVSAAGKVSSAPKASPNMQAGTRSAGRKSTSTKGKKSS